MGSGVVDDEVNAAVCSLVSSLDSLITDHYYRLRRQSPTIHNCKAFRGGERGAFHFRPICGSNWEKSQPEPSDFVLHRINIQSCWPACDNERDSSCLDGRKLLATVRYLEQPVRCGCATATVSVAQIKRHSSPVTARSLGTSATASRLNAKGLAKSCALSLCKSWRLFASIHCSDWL